MFSAPSASWDSKAFFACYIRKISDILLIHHMIFAYDTAYSVTWIVTVYGNVAITPTYMQVRQDYRTIDLNQVRQFFKRTLRLSLHSILISRSQDLRYATGEVIVVSYILNADHSMNASHYYVTVCSDTLIWLAEKYMNCQHKLLPITFLTQILKSVEFRIACNMLMEVERVIRD